MHIPIWLMPGGTIKRWLLVYVAGQISLILGIAYVLHTLYHRRIILPHFAYYVTLQAIPESVRGLLLIASGVLILRTALQHLNKIVFSTIVNSRDFAVSASTTVIDAAQRYRLLQRGPRIVAIGGGREMSNLLRELRTYSRNLSVIVTVPGGGDRSGQLQHEETMLSLADYWQSIVALADTEPLMFKLLEYRFEKGLGLAGHSFSALLLTAMLDIQGGSFGNALSELSRVLAVHGQIIPSTLDGVTLAARPRDKLARRGESVSARDPVQIESVYLVPGDLDSRIVPNLSALDALRKADMIVVGLGSLHTSTMPSLLVPGLAQAIKESKAALKVFVYNVGAVAGGAEACTASMVAHAVERRVHLKLFDYLITINTHTILQRKDDKEQGSTTERRRFDARTLAHVLLRLYRSERHGTNLADVQSGLAQSGIVLEALTSEDE